ncbi:MAG TPA: SAM-dependent chlorinase/fluorinase [Candidatus Limnocylindrales bacterium]|nr:SAM-dependent chlorinase/fluorinase [Candidatus Limnocylindrales bacterium]
MPERPVIGFLTDFGLDGAAAICRGVMLSIARDAQIVDISHVVRKFAISDGAYLLRAALPWLPVGTHVAVVDPGVGTSRRPVGILTARGDALIGPDNGLLLPAAERLGGIREARVLDNRDWMLPTTSATFHGRDIFAPIAAHLAVGGAFAAIGSPIDPGDLVRLGLPGAAARPGRLDTGVVYVDSFGNLRLDGTAADLASSIPELHPGMALVLELPTGDLRATFARTFGEVAAGDLLVYEDSAGDLALGESTGNAARRLGLQVGTRIGLRRA